MNTITIEFYHAKWCGWCQKFKPDWNKLKELFKNDKNLKSVTHEKIGEYKSDGDKTEKHEKEQIVLQYSDKKIILVDYEEGDDPQKIIDEGVTAFPTIKIKVNNKSMDYPKNKKREAQSIYDFIINKEYEQEQNINDVNNGGYKQCGGGKVNDNYSLRSEHYKLKYYKYKYKYMKLKDYKY